jgi:nucleoside-diphosphate-sugar epimerase
MRHSRANIDKASQRLAYVPFYHVREGIEAAAPWYIQHERSALDSVQRQPEANLL